jgi:hypothetical protein
MGSKRQLELRINPKPEEHGNASKKMKLDFLQEVKILNLVKLKDSPRL